MRSHTLPLASLSALTPLKRALQQLLRLCCTLTLVSASLPSLVSAQSDNPRVQTALRQAQEFTRSGKYKEAAEAYRRAISLEPNPALLFEVAKRYQQANEKREALRYFKLFVDEIPSDARVSDAMIFIKQLEDELKDQYEELVVTSQPRGAYVYIDTRANGSIGQTPLQTKLLPGEYQVIAELDGYVMSSQLIKVERGVASQVAISLYNEQEVAPITFLVNRADARLYLDGRLLARTPIEEPLLIRQGTHVVRVMLAGHGTWEQELRVEAQRPQTVSVQLQEQSMEGALAQDPPQAQSGGGGSVGPWVTMGVGALLLSGSAYTGFSAQRIYNQLDERRSNELPIVAGDIEMGDTYVLMTNLLLGLGAASLTAGGVWWATQPSDSPSTLALEPTLTPNAQAQAQAQAHVISSELGGDLGGALTPPLPLTSPLNVAQ